MIRTRFNGTYAEYLAKQASKAADESFRASMEARRGERVAWFRRQFDGLVSVESGSALCLGARYGEEVEALRGIGWTTRGIDLAAYPPWVDVGDMNEPPRGKYDLIYTNAFDHCWNPGQFAQNLACSLNDGGLTMLHIASGPAGAFETVEWDSVDDVVALLRSCGLTCFVAKCEEFYGLDTSIVGVAP